MLLANHKPTPVTVQGEQYKYNTGMSNVIALTVALESLFAKHTPGRRKDAE